MSINATVSPVFEKATAASPGPIMAAAINCWCESVWPRHGAPKRSKVHRERPLVGSGKMTAVVFKPN
jgi:hypothetical protein